MPKPTIFKAKNKHYSLFIQTINPNSWFNQGPSLMANPNVIQTRILKHKTILKALNYN